MVRTRSSKIFHQKQNDQQKDESPMCTRFFKIVFGKDRSRVLYVPPYFAPRVKHLVNQQIQFEDSFGQQWSMTLSRDVDGALIFKKGWHKFYQDHVLEEGQLLVFDRTKEDHFIVHIFGTHACERTSFNKERPPQNKRSRRDPEIDSESEQFRKTGTNLRDRSCSNSSVAFENSEILQMNIEDPNCMINRYEEHQVEGINILYDLSVFEMGSMIKLGNQYKEIDTEISNSHPEIVEYAVRFGEATDPKVASSHTGSAQHIKTHVSDTQLPAVDTNLVDGRSSDVFNGNFNKGLDTESAPRQTEMVEQHKMMGHNSQIAVDHKDEISGSSNEIITMEFKKDPASNTSPPCSGIIEKTKSAGIIKKTKRKIDDTEIPAVHADSVNGNSGGFLGGNFDTKPSDHNILSKDMLDNVLNFLHGRENATERENTAIHQCLNSATSSTMLRNPVGKEPNTVWKNSQVISSVVKIEPDLSFDISPSDACSGFSAKVKSLSFLELPVQIPSVAGRREMGRGRIVYLKGSSGTIWPVFYPDTCPVIALTSNWSNFCKQNNIKVGDKCRFEAENDMLWSCRVDVTHSSDDFLAIM